ncbi:MAG: discoidin domain-containing protein [bacterium]
MKRFYCIVTLSMCAQLMFAQDLTTTVISDELVAKIAIAGEMDASVCTMLGVNQLVTTKDEEIRKQSIEKLVALLKNKETTTYGKLVLLRVLLPYADQVKTEDVAACLEAPLTKAQAMRILDAKGDKRGALSTIVQTPENACVKAYRDIQKDPKAFATYIVSTDKKVREVAIACAASVPTADLMVTYKAVSSDNAKVLILKALATRKDKACYPLFIQEANVENETLAVAALMGLTPLATGADIPLFVKALEKSPDIANAARTALVVMNDPKTESSLLASKGKLPILLDIIGDRALPTATDTLIPYTSKAEADDVRASAWRNIRKVVNETRVPLIIAQLQDTHESDINNAEQALLSATKEMDSAKRNAIVLGSWGKASDKTTRGVMFSMMQRFKDASFEPEFVKLISSENELSQEALRTLCSYTPPSKNSILAMLKYASDNKKQQSIASRLYNANGIETFVILQAAFDSAQDGVAKKIYRNLYDKQFESLKTKADAKLTQSRFKAKASHNDRDVKKAFDNDPTSRWTSNKQSEPNMWFELDIGEQAFVASLTLDTAKSKNDTPNGCEVRVSLNGKEWSDVVATADGMVTPVFTLTINKTARFIKITSKGSRKGLNWSIHELTVNSGIPIATLDAIQQTATNIK